MHRISRYRCYDSERGVNDVTNSCDFMGLGNYPPGIYGLSALLCSRPPLDSIFMRKGVRRFTPVFVRALG